MYKRKLVIIQMMNDLFLIGDIQPDMTEKLEGDKNYGDYFFELN